MRHRERIKLSSLCKSGSFSYGESPRTPPLEGTSLHRRNNSVERPWGILSLFTTCSHHVWILSRVCSWHSHIYVCGVLVKQVVFLTVNHRGPLPLRELHSTDETLVWRDPRGSWACLQPVSNYKWINSPCQRVWHRPVWLFFFFFFFSFLFSSLSFFAAGRFSYSQSPRTPPLEGTSLHRWNNSVERPWGIVSLFTTCCRIRVDSPCLK